MRGQSYSNKKNNSNKEDFQGGETKVMKKSLKMLLVFALVFSMFAPAIGFAAEAEMDAQAKFDAMVEAGILEGIDGEAALDKNMQRNEVAKILANIFELEVVAGAPTPFPDEPADNWGYTDGYIQAVVAAGLMQGGSKEDGTIGFRPNDQLSLQELAVVLNRALDLPAGDEVEGKTSSWATDAVAAVVAAGLLPASDDFTVEATRGDLVSSTFEVYVAYVASQVLTVESLTVTGAKKLAITFSKAVDTDMVTFALTKGAVTVNTDKVEFSEDKMSAVITTTTNLTKGEYTVTVTGASEELAVKVEVEDVKVSEINITSQKAPRLSGDDTKALVSYEVLNQYGEKMTGQSISWTISTGIVVANENTIAGTFEITAAGSLDFIPGALVYITGVHASSGTVFNGQVEVVLSAKAATADFKGVYDTTTSKLVDLPAGFADGRYVLLLEVIDQYGNKMPAPSLTDLVFTSNNPLFVSSDTGSGAFASAADVTIDDVVYKAVDLDPGSAVANGGSVTIQAISTITGTISSFTATSDALAAVKTFTMSAPAKLIAEGETVEIPYTAEDQYGNAVTKFSSLSAVTLSPAFNLGAGLKFVEQNDGSAKLKYTAPLTGASDNADLPVYFTSLVANGGNFSSLMVYVKETARPTAVVGLNDKKVTSVAKDVYLTFKGQDLIIQDQYGRTMTIAAKNTWLDVGGANSILVSSSDATSSPFEVSVVGVGTDAASQVIVGSSTEISVNANVTTSVATETIKFELATSNDGTSPMATSAKAITFTKVEHSSYVSYEVKDLGTMYNNGATNLATNSDYDKTVVVYGVLANGTKVVLPASDYAITTTGELDVTGNVLSDDATGGYVGADFQDNTGTYADVEDSILVTVNDNDTGAALSIMEKDILVSNKAPKATTITLDSDLVTDGKAIVNPAVATVDAALLKSFVLEVVDQYGVDNTTVPTITITNLEKVDGSTFTVTGNASTTTSIAGAAMGDKFTATLKYGSASVKVDFTVGLPQ